MTNTTIQKTNKRYKLIRLLSILAMIIPILIMFIISGGGANEDKTVWLFASFFLGMLGFAYSAIGRWWNNE